MNPWIAKAVVLIATAVMIGIRAPHGQRSRQMKVMRSYKGPLEMVVLFFAWLGFFIPLIWLFSPAFAFAEYASRPGLVIAGSIALAFSLWIFWHAHTDLGTNWSVTLEVREQHQLITRGIYARVRHPMYTSLFLYAIGQMLVIPNWFVGPVYLVSFGVLFVCRIRAEEQMMLDQFGEAYAQYASRTKRLIPGVW